MLVTSPCPGMVWARVGSEATDPEALSSPSVPPVSLVTSLASSWPPGSPLCLLTPRARLQFSQCVLSALADGRLQVSQSSLLRKVGLQSLPSYQPPNREQVSLGAWGRPLSGPGVTAAYSPHAWVSGGTGGTGRWLSSRPTTPCPKEEEAPQKPGSCCAGSEQGDRGIQASWSCRLSRGPVRPQQPPSALPQLRTPSTSFSPCRLRGQSHICGASQLLCLSHHLQLGSPSV